MYRRNFVTAVFEAAAACTFTGLVTVAPPVGSQMVTEGAVPVGAHVPVAGEAAARGSITSMKRVARIGELRIVIVVGDGMLIRTPGQHARMSGRNSRRSAEELSGAGCFVVSQNIFAKAYMFC
jgi:hypothetical protein